MVMARESRVVIDRQSRDFLFPLHLRFGPASEVRGWRGSCAWSSAPCSSGQINSVVIMPPSYTVVMGHRRGSASSFMIGAAAVSNLAFNVDLLHRRRIWPECLPSADGAQQNSGGQPRPLPGPRPSRWRKVCRGLFVGGRLEELLAHRAEPWERRGSATGRCHGGESGVRAGTLWRRAAAASGGGHRCRQHRAGQYSQTCKRRPGRQDAGLHIRPSWRRSSAPERDALPREVLIHVIFSEADQPV